MSFVAPRLQLVCFHFYSATPFCTVCSTGTNIPVQPRQGAYPYSEKVSYHADSQSYLMANYGFYRGDTNVRNLLLLGELHIIDITRKKCG